MERSKLPAREVAEDVALPDDRAVLQAETGEIAVLGEGIDAIAVGGRRAARPGTAVVVASRPERAAPDDFAVLAIERKHQALTVARPLDEHTIATNGD